MTSSIVGMNDKDFIKTGDIVDEGDVFSIYFVGGNSMLATGKVVNELSLYTLGMPNVKLVTINHSVLINPDNITYIRKVKDGNIYNG